MAVSSVPRLNRPTRKTWGLIATADGDTEIVIAHGMALSGYSPTTIVVRVQNLLPAARVSDWIVQGFVGLTTVTVSKTTGVGSGDPGEQALLEITLPHSIVGNAIPPGV